MSVVPLVALNGSGPERHEWPALEPQALHGILGEVVRLIEPSTEADPAAILLHLLTLSGISIGPGPRAWAGLEAQPARLQLWVVGDSALGRKGAAWGAARTVMAVADAEFMEKRVLSGFGSGEALVDAAADEEARDCRLMVLAREGTHLLSVMARRGDTTSTVLRDVYDTDTLAVRSRAKTSVAKLAHIGLIAHITPADLVAGLSETDIRNGFANRGLFCCARRRKLLPRGGPVDSTVNQAAVELGHLIREARKVGVLSFEEMAGYAWDLAYESFGHGAPSSLLRDLEARGDMHCLRLSMIFTLLDGGRTIELAHFHAALAVWRYCRDSARFLFGPEGAVEEARELNALQKDRQRFEDRLARLHAALMDSGSLTRRQQFEVFGRHLKATEIGALRKELVSRGEAGEVNGESGSSGGRPARILVPVDGS